ncbi:MAG: hypothetical protein WA414_07160 [Acidobacteriaceae bacterium]
MSGFLQRLASGVLHGQRAIHPVVGTVWSPPGAPGGDPMESPGTTEAIEASPEVRAASPVRPQEAVAQISTKKSNQRQTEHGVSLSDNVARRHAEQPSISEANDFAPLVALSRPNVETGLPGGSQVVGHTEQNATASTPGPQETAVEHAGVQQHRIESTRPLVAAPRIPVAARVGAAKAAAVLPASQRRVQAAEPTVEKPDSIEIHIGRIEVLAAPPRPAKATAPAPARKSLDLGEYLRRERRPQ